VVVVVVVSFVEVVLDVDEEDVSVATAPTPAKLAATRKPQLARMGRLSSLGNRRFIRTP
jgi:hypothetical protein